MLFFLRKTKNHTGTILNCGKCNIFLQQVCYLALNRLNMVTIITDKRHNMIKKKHSSFIMDHKSMTQHQPRPFMQNRLRLIWMHFSHFERHRSTNLGGNFLCFNFPNLRRKISSAMFTVLPKEDSVASNNIKGDTLNTYLIII